MVGYFRGELCLDLVAAASELHRSAGSADGRTDGRLYLRLRNAERNPSAAVASVGRWQFLQAGRKVRSFRGFASELSPRSHDVPRAAALSSEGVRAALARAGERNCMPVT